VVPPLPLLLDCGALAGACNPLWPLDVLLLDPCDEPEVLEEPEESDFPAVPDFPAAPEVADEPLPWWTAVVWLAPGRTAASPPTAATLTADKVIVVAFSRRRPCSRSATACAIRRARLACSAPARRAARRLPDGPPTGAGSACPAACAAGSSRLFTFISVARPAGCAAGKSSQDALSALGPARWRRYLLHHAELPVNPFHPALRAEDSTGQ
jgi:hypothetical protein